MRLLSSGCLDIGTTSVPVIANTLLNVNGGVEITGTATISNKVIQNIGASNNLQYGDTNTYNSINTGNDNIVVGKTSGTALTNGNNNILFGNNSGNSLTTGNNNVLIGRNAGNTTTGSSKIAIGSNTSQTASNASSTIAIGLNAGNNNQGTNSIAIGEDAGKDNLSLECIAIGRDAGKISIAQGTVAIGNKAMWRGNVGTGCIAIGADSGGLVAANVGNASIAIGNGAGGYSSGMGQYSVSLGALSHSSENSISIGFNTGSFSGKNSIIIGAGGLNQKNNYNHNIVLNAMEVNIANVADDRCYINPIREDLTSTSSFIRYDTTSKELITQTSDNILGPLRFIGDNTTVGRSYNNCVMDAAQLQVSKVILQSSLITMNYDPLLATSSTIVYLAGVNVGTAMTLINGQIYKGIILHQVSLTTTDYKAFIYTVDGVLLASSAAAVSMSSGSTNRPFRIPFSADYLHTSPSGVYFVGFNTDVASTSLTGTNNGYNNWQSPRANKFDLRSGSIAGVGGTIPSPITGTLTQGGTVPWVGLYF
jgi:hypothetical protein